MIFRNDDINPNVRLEIVDRYYDIIHSLFPSAEIISCVTLFGVGNYRGAIYPQVPFKDKPLDFFYNVDTCIREIHTYPNTQIASHGLFHVDSTKLDYQAQEMNIVGSCNFLKTRIFVPPFNRYNSITEEICEKNGIMLVKPDSWKSLEYEDFNMEHKNWYFHSWKMTPEKLRGILTNGKHSTKLGQL